MTEELIEVEVVLKCCSTITENKIANECSNFLSLHKYLPGTVISSEEFEDNLLLHENVEHIIIIGEQNLKNGYYIDFKCAHVKWLVYHLDPSGPQVENHEDGDGESVSLATLWVVPSAEFFSLWENLIFDSNIKQNLLQYTSTTMLFSDKGVNSNIVSCNRVVLLHGPPGTGKTSLCKALANKLAVRMQHRFKQSVLVEINSHSLFSKWFSESGKLVTKMFSKVREIIDDPKILVCVLMDEVESLVNARNQSRSEPSDAVRAVNAVLTQIDQIKRYPNVIILATSNMTGLIDLAFVDRADIKQFIGLPTVQAIYQIYYSCIQELQRAGIIYPKVAMSIFCPAEDKELQRSKIFDSSKKLYEISELSSGLSGRVLRKIPFLAHALFVQTEKVTLGDFLVAMAKAVEHQESSKTHFV